MDSYLVWLLWLFFNLILVVPDSLMFGHKES